MGTELRKLLVQATVLDRDDDAPTACVADAAGPVVTGLRSE
jgi:hypothetical protein